MQQFPEVDAASLRPNPWNTNTVSAENQEKLKASIERVGMFKPVIVRELDDGELEILGGEHRAEAAAELGVKVPVFNLGRISETKAKEIGLLDNARYGSDDAGELAELLKELGEDDLTEFMPWSESDLDLMLSASSVDLDDLDVDESDDEPADEPAETKAPKTHRIMRFKVAIGDDERVSDLIEKTKKRLGYTEADELTNAGDALIALLLGGEDA